MPTSWEKETTASLKSMLKALSGLLLLEMLLFLAVVGFLIVESLSSDGQGDPVFWIIPAFIMVSQVILVQKVVSIAKELERRGEVRLSTLDSLKSLFK